MKREDEPVTDDEFILRLVWTTRYKPELVQPVVKEAFEPRKSETDGISVFRMSCLLSPEQALNVIAFDKRDRYALVVLPVAEVVKLGLTILPAPIADVPGHAVVPELLTAAQRRSNFLT
jgi:hypothetical protein